MHKLSHILRLGLKELTSLRHDSVLLLFLLYAFTVAIYMPASSSIIGVHNASVAIIDEDHSPLSRKLGESLLPPEFKAPQALPYDQLDQAMDNGQYTFVINVPANFQADLLAGRQPGLQVNVELVAGTVDVPVAVATTALQKVRDWTVVFGRYGEYLEARPLELGRTDGKYVEIVSGLNAGEVYAAANSFLIKADLEKSGASHDH